VAPAPTQGPIAPRGSTRGGNNKPLLGRLDKITICMGTPYHSHTHIGPLGSA